MSEGFLYVSADDEFLTEARSSARRLDEVMPEYPIGIVTDAPEPGDVFDDRIELEDPEYGFSDKARSLDLSPYDRTIYLDGDTYLTEPIPEVFESLDRFDVCAVQDMGRNYYASDIDVPATVPEYNCGLIAYQSSHRVRRFLETWVDIYRRHRERGIDADQPAFRKAVWETDVDVGTLPAEYNCRVNEPGALGLSAKLIHGRRNDSLQSVEEKLNRTSTWRVHSPVADDVGVFSPESASLFQHVLYSVATNGISDTARIAKRRLF